MKQRSALSPADTRTGLCFLSLTLKHKPQYCFRQVESGSVSHGRRVRRAGAERRTDNTS